MTKAPLLAFFLILAYKHGVSTPYRLALETPTSNLNRFKILILLCIFMTAVSPYCRFYRREGPKHSVEPEPTGVLFYNDMGLSVLAFSVWLGGVASDWKRLSMLREACLGERNRLISPLSRWVAKLGASVIDRGPRHLVRHPLEPPTTNFFVLP